MNQQQSAKQRVLDAIRQENSNITFSRLMEVSGLEFMELSAIIGLLFKERKIGLYFLPYREDGSSYTPRVKALFEQFMNLLMEHYTHERRVAFYANQLCVTPKYLSVVIKQASGRTPHSWINEMIFMEMEQRLRCTQFSVKEIANAMHFPSLSFFGKFFRAHYGMSPLQYRQKLLADRK